MSNRPATLIPLIQQLLHNYFGPLNWWPADSPFEVAVGAILTQNTAWANVEYAIDNLKQAQVLTVEGIACAPRHQLEKLIRPSGFFRQKAVRLQNLASHITKDCQGDLSLLCGGPLEVARAKLISLPGIGPETADSILLYAANRPSFVIDAYTRRIFQRIGILHGQETYDEIRALFMQHLVEDVALYNEYHAQIVQLAKTCCRKKHPLCLDCPVKTHCQHAMREEPESSP